MPVKNVKLFERDERKGWKLLMPLEGKRIYDSNLLNPEAAKIFDDLRKGQKPTQIIDSICREHSDVPYECIKHDVYATIVKLRELGVYEMTKGEAEEICSSPAKKLPGLHVMDEIEIRDLSEKLKIACVQESGMLFYAFDKLKCDDTLPFKIRSWHFNAVYTFCLHNDQNGNMDGVISLAGLGALSPVIPIGILAVFDKDEKQRFKIAEEILKQSEILVKSFTRASKLRFIVYKKDKDRTDLDATPFCQQSGISTECRELYSLLEKCGFWHEITLNHEGGSGIHIEYYTKQLVEESITERSK